VADNIELLYHAFHVMTGLGIVHFVDGRRISWVAGRSCSRTMLWMLMLAFPFHASQTRRDG
jgi:hypothetical protein